MKILIIGGTYFLGPAFIRRALEQGHEITVFNRGTRKTGRGRVKEIKGDRSVYEDLVRARGDYDAVVDFCAYKKGDIDRVRKALDGNAYRYVFISTVDVYRRNTGEVLTEDAEFETRDFGGEAGAYILGKAALEKDGFVTEREWMCQFEAPSITIGGNGSVDVEGVTNSKEG